MCVQSVCREAAGSQRLPAVQRPRETAHHEGNYTNMEDAHRHNAAVNIMHLMQVREPEPKHWSVDIWGSGDGRRACGAWCPGTVP